MGSGSPLISRARGLWRPTESLTALSAGTGSAETLCAPLATKPAAQEMLCWPQGSGDEGGRTDAIPRQGVAAPLMCLTLAVAFAAPAAAATAGNVQAKPIGDLIWKPTDLNLFTAPIGTADTGYVEFGETQVAILPEPNHRPHPALGIGPGDPHARPYNHEIRRGLKSLGFDRGAQFTVEDFSDGNCLSAGVHGRPQEPRLGAKGIVAGLRLRTDHSELAASLIDVTGSAERFGEPFSVLADFSVPPLDDIAGHPSFDVDGHSHFPIFIADNIDFALTPVDPAGRYEWTLRMLDQTGNGWKITVRFVIREN